MRKRKIDVKEIYEHYMKTLGAIPEEVQTLGDNAPELLDAYYRIRRFAFKQPGALSKKVRELILVALACELGVTTSPYNHVRAALDAGATKDEILEVIAISCFMAGMPKFVFGGHAALKEAVEYEKEKRAGLARGKK